MLAIRLPEEMETRLAALAEKTGRSKSYYAKEAIAQFLEEQEDLYLVIERLKERNENVSLDEVKKILGMDD